MLSEIFEPVQYGYFGTLFAKHCLGTSSTSFSFIHLPFRFDQIFHVLERLPSQPSSPLELKGMDRTPRVIDCSEWFMAPLPPPFKSANKRSFIFFIILKEIDTCNISANCYQTIKWYTTSPWHLITLLRKWKST